MCTLQRRLSCNRAVAFRAAVIVLLALCCADPTNAQEAVQRATPESRSFHVVLLGDTGDRPTQALYAALRTHFQSLSAQSVSRDERAAALVMLGNQLPSGGLPPRDHRNRAEAEERLDALIATARTFPGRVIVIPGEHDYSTDLEDRVRSIKRQEDYVEDALGEGTTFLPNNGYPGPHELKLSDDLRLVALNTSWLLNSPPNPVGTPRGMTIRENQDVFRELNAIVRDRFGDDLLVVGHHALFAGHGERGGILRSSTTRESSEQMPRAILSILKEHENFVYASGRGGGLEYYQSKRGNFSQSVVMSGSRGRIGHVPVPEDFEAKFSNPAPGFITIDYYSDGAIWLDAWSVPIGALNTDESIAPRHIGEHLLRRPENNIIEAASAASNGTPRSGRDNPKQNSTVVRAPNARYSGSFVGRMLFGSNHRVAWTTPVSFPLLDMKSEKGGLMAVKRGGGLQSTSVRLRAADDRQYVLRSIKKDWGSILNVYLSMAHPFADLPVPRLADAVGVYHSTPRLVIAPHAEELGSFRELIGGKLVLFEERPTNDMSMSPNYGRSEEVIGWSEMYGEVVSDNDNRVDMRFMARNRLFDLWLSDWDRHRDQWRWASFDDPDGQGTLYRPIPRDRDNAFLRLNGLFYRLSQPFVKVQGFNAGFGSVSGLATQGRHQDHRLLGGLNREDWLAIADSMRIELTDEAITSAFQEWPEEIFDLQGADMIATGKARRDQLADVAESFYRLHARSVDLLGSDKHERFEIHRAGDDHTEIVMYKTNKEGEIQHELVRRRIDHADTREVILYGLGGDDTFVVTGRVNRSVHIHAIGGSGDDRFEDRSHVRGPSRRTRFYDTKLSTNSFEAGTEARVVQSDDPAVHLYHGTYEFERVMPFGTLTANSDDGVSVSAGPRLKRHAFGGGWTHSAQVGYSSRGGAISAAYSLVHDRSARDLPGGWRVGVDLRFHDRNATSNFYGAGNSSVGAEGFRDGLARFTGRLPVSRVPRSDMRLEIAPTLDVSELASRSVVHTPSGAKSWLVPEDRLVLGGLDLEAQFESVDHAGAVRNGYRLVASTEARQAILGGDNMFARASSSLALYASLPHARRFTLAIRVGGSTVLGSFPYFYASTLGSQQNLRGFPGSRYTGRSSAYVNTDLRVEVVRDWGLLGHVDHGKVWFDGANSDEWHRGAGYGLWHELSSELLISVSRSHSSDHTSYRAGVGFFY